MYAWQIRYAKVQAHFLNFECVAIICDNVDREKSVILMLNS